MPELPSPDYVNLDSVIHKTISASNAVAKSISTHTEREEARRKASRQVLEAQRRLNSNPGAPHG